MQTNQSIGDVSSRQWWRWPLMPLASIAGACAGSIVIGLFLWFTMKLQGGFSEDGWFYIYVTPVISSIAFGYNYSYIACSVAPCGKVIAGTVMATLLAIFLIGGVVIFWTSPAKTTEESVQITIGAVACIVAAITALVEAHSQEKTRGSHY